MSEVEISRKDAKAQRKDGNRKIFQKLNDFQRWHCEEKISIVFD
jgi:hypothetical protein